MLKIKVLKLLCIHVIKILLNVSKYKFCHTCILKKSSLRVNAHLLCHVQSAAHAWVEELRDAIFIILEKIRCM